MKPLDNPVLCPASGCNAVLGSTDGTRFEPDDEEFVVERPDEDMGTKVWVLRCRCGKERRWPG